MKRYFITITDTFGNSRQILVTKKELKTIEKYNPELIIEPMKTHII